MSYVTERLRNAPLEVKAAYVEDGLVSDIAMLLKDAMETADVSNTALADRIGRHRSEITRILNGRNVTVSTIARCFAALELKLKLNALPLVSYSVPAVGNFVYLASPTKETKQPDGYSWAA